MPEPYDYGMGVDDVHNYMRTVIMIDEAKRARAAEAIRWQGAQEYDTLVKSGIEPGDAMRRTAGKLFFNDPRGLASAAENLSQRTGQIKTDPESGRQYIEQPTGRIQPLPNISYGQTTVRGQYGQEYRIPLTREELATAPRTSAPPVPPQVVEYPGYGSAIVQPSGVATQLRPSALETVRWKNPATGAMETLTHGEMALREAQMEAAPLLDEYQKYAIERKVGEKRWGPDWNWLPMETYEQKQIRLAEKLKAYDLNPDGTPIPGSRLAREAGLEATPAPNVQPAPIGQPSPQTAPAAPRQGVPSVSLKPNEVLLRKRLPDGNWRYDVFDANTKQFLYRAQ